MKTLSTSLLLAGMLCLSGCTKTEPGTAPTAADKKPATPAAVTPAPGNPAAAEGLRGVVTERLEVPSYTYFKVKGPKGETWAAVPTSPIQVGTEVTITNPVPMHNFQSKTLNRTFEIIMFGSGATAAGAEAAGATPAATPGMSATSMPNPHGNQGATTPASSEKITVAKATGSDAYTVAEVYEKKAALKDKNVSVRAKVVKVTSGVLGKTWLHLRDGSGTDAARNNDLVATTTEDVKTNDEITVSGVVHTDKDLGAGYVYSVLIEDAKITK